jgi:hypothetical protein
MKDIKPTDKVCYNCKYLLWMVGIGAGLRCGYNMKNTLKIPSSKHTCHKFKINDRNNIHNNA